MALSLGQSVIIDASFIDDSQRRMALKLADETWATLIALECHAPVGIVAERLASRTGKGDDASDADIAISRAMSEDAEAWPEAISLDTSGELTLVVREALSAVNVVDV